MAGQGTAALELSTRSTASTRWSRRSAAAACSPAARDRAGRRRLRRRARGRRRRRRPRAEGERVAITCRGRSPTVSRRPRPASVRSRFSASAPLRSSPSRTPSSSRAMRFPLRAAEARRGADGGAASAWTREDPRRPRRRRPLGRQRRRRALRRAARNAPAARVPPRPWTSTSTRARSSSGASGSRSPRGASPRPRTRRERLRRELGGPVVVKAQVLTGGRGKAGGIKLADARGRAREGRGDPRHGHPGARRPPALDRAAPTSRRSTTSRSRSTGARRSRCSCSRRRAASTSRRSRRRAPRRSSRLHVDPLEGFQPWIARRLVYGAGVDDPGEQKQIAAIVEQLYAAFVGTDAMLCEINPLIVTPDGEVKALDSKFTVDDNALYRHADVAEMRDPRRCRPRSASRARRTSPT